MKKQLLYLVLTCFATSIISAQQVKYTVEENNTETVPRLNVRVSPIYFNLSKLSQAEVGFALGATYELNDKMGFNLDFHRPFGRGMNMTYHTSRNAVNSETNKFPMSNYVDVSYRHVLSNKVKTGKTKIHLSTEYSGDKEINTSLKAEADKRVRTVGRAGIFNYSGIINNQQHLDDEHFMGNDSVSLEGHYAAPFTVLSVYGGISFQHFMSGVFSVDGYQRKKEKHQFTDFYMDVMFAPMVNIQDIIRVDGEAIDITGKEEGNISASRLGWRVGFVSQDLKPDKFINWGWKLEVGSRPGIKSYGLYMDAHLLMGLNW